MRIQLEFNWHRFDFMASRIVDWPFCPFIGLLIEDSLGDELDDRRVQLQVERVEVSSVSGDVSACLCLTDLNIARELRIAVGQQVRAALERDGWIVQEN